jgi:hypothetical protein
MDYREQIEERDEVIQYLKSKLEDLSLDEIEFP